MRITAFCGAAAALPARRGWPALVLAGLLATGVSGCATGPEAGKPDPAAVAQAERSAQQPLPFDAAVASLAQSLVAHAQLGAPDANGRYPLIVDPWVDRVSGNQVGATRNIETMAGTLIRTNFPQIELLPFSAASLQRRPLVLLGAVSPVAGAGDVQPVSTGRPAAYHVWGVIADLRSGKIVSKADVWAEPGTVDIRPAAFFRDSPTLMTDSATESYFRAISGKIGDPVDPAYLEGLRAGALINDGIRAYEGGRYQEALGDYTEAARSPAGDQPRVYNGLYLANQALNRPGDAEAAFSQAVGYGLTHGKLSLKLVFRPNSTAFWADPAVSGPYPMWLREIARQAAGRDACLTLVGHSSPSGDEPANLRLSRARAEAVRQRLLADQPELRGHLAAEGVGSRENIVGTGADDATDVLDRRVEFRVTDCATLRT